MKVKSVFRVIIHIQNPTQIHNRHRYARPVKPTPVEIGLHQLINKTLSSLTIPKNVKVSIAIEEDFPKLTLDPILSRVSK